MDICLTDNLDFLIVDNTIAQQENGETTMIQAFFSDARVNNLRGYWLELPLSKIWQYDQSRLTREVANNLNEEATEIAKKLVKLKLYDRIETDVTIQDTVLTLHVWCYDKRQLVINRKFAI